MTRLYRGMVSSIFVFLKIFRRACMIALKPMFKSCGSGVIFYPFDMFSHSSIAIGNNVFIGKGAVFLASESSISIGDGVMFGPNVTIMGGDHNTSEVGRFMIDVKEKRPGDDRPVVVEDDVWVGTGAIILKGVVIGRGSIIAAGSVVTRSVPEFSVAGGVPCKVWKQRFGEQELALHKRMLKLRD